jgi:hypothetical protein
MKEDADNLDRRMKGFYERQSLDEETLDLLKTTIAVVGGHPDVVPARMWWPRLRLVRHQAFQAAAAVLFLIAAVTTWYGIRDIHPSALDRQVAAEIALNHNKQLRLEYETVDMAELRTAMDKLDFAPVDPQRLQDGGYFLVGARYSSIGATLAVQLRMTDDLGRPYTLYQFRDGEAFADLTETTLDVDGVRVILWRESGLVLALAQPRP